MKKAGAARRSRFGSGRRPFGATLGDTLTKPRNEGGLALGRIVASAVIAGLILVGIAVAARGNGGGLRRG